MVLKSKVIIPDIRDGSGEEATKKLDSELASISKDELVSVGQTINPSGKIVYTIVYDEKNKKVLKE